MLINLTDKIAELEKRKMTCEWSEVEAIQNKINHYIAKVSQDILFEPAF